MQWLSRFDNVYIIIKDNAIITVKNVDYRFIVQNISKSKAINLLKKTVLENRGYL